MEKRIKIKKRKTLIIDSPEQNQCEALKRKYETTKLNARENNNLLRCISEENHKRLQMMWMNINIYITDDVDFNVKIASKKEFYDNRYEEKTPEDFENNKQIAQNYDTEFELSPHQMFVRNFMSFETPYNSLLLYHGLGTGKHVLQYLYVKTCRHI